MKAMLWPMANKNLQDDDKLSRTSEQIEQEQVKGPGLTLVDNSDSASNLDDNNDNSDKVPGDIKG